MKAVRLPFLLLALLSIASCGDDDSPCGQSEWVGTYTGTQVCNALDAEGVTVTITANGTDALNISYTTASGGGTSFNTPLIFDGCSINFSQTAGGASTTVEATLMGDELMLRDVLVFGGMIDCSITATRD